ncbi:MAG: group 1 glycosyl transferase [Pseudomonadota bacterium]|jgi:glycosyltransferase involved in cell wall biosynthesis|nr:glycosyltransferase [Burkholderiales bacterium]
MQATVLILCFSDLKKDPRVFRQIYTLKDNYNVIAAGYCDPEINNVKFIKLAEIPGRFGIKKILQLFYLQTRQFEKYYWSKKTFVAAYQQLLKVNCDLILANDSDAWPLAINIAKIKKIKCICDAHEYTPGEFENSRKWRWLWQKYRTYLCLKYLTAADAMITVCNPIAYEYQRVFNLKPVVITNAPSFQELLPKPIESNIIKIIHHGLAAPGRKIELMIEMMKYLDQRFTLDFMLVGQGEYFERLRSLAKFDERIKFIPPVAMVDIANKVNAYDIGLFLLENNSINANFALPNKFFEYIQGRLMIAIGPSPAMAEYVNQYDLGVIADNFMPQTLAQKLNLISSEEIWYYKNQSHKIADKLSANSNNILLNQMIASTLNAI